LCVRDIDRELLCYQLNLKFVEDTAQEKADLSSITQQILVTAVFLSVTDNWRETIFKDLLQGKSE